MAKIVSRAVGYVGTAPYFCRYWMLFESFVLLGGSCCWKRQDSKEAALYVREVGGNCVRASVPLARFLGEAIGGGDMCENGSHGETGCSLITM